MYKKRNCFNSMVIWAKKNDRHDTQKVKCIFMCLVCVTNIDKVIYAIKVH